MNIYVYICVCVYVCVYVCIQPGRIKEVGEEKKRKEGLNSGRKEGKEQSNVSYLGYASA